MHSRKDLLLRTAARLYSLGIDLEAAREHIKLLVEAGTAYDAPEMIQAVEEYQEQKRQWDELEQAYLQLRSEILGMQ